MNHRKNQSNLSLDQQQKNETSFADTNNHLNSTMATQLQTSWSTQKRAPTEGAKQGLENALNQVKGRQSFTLSQRNGRLLELEAPLDSSFNQRQRHSFYLVDKDRDFQTQPKYHDKNIEESLMDIIQDDTDSELGPPIQPETKTVVIKRIEEKFRTSWVEILLLVAVFVVAYLGQNSMNNNRQIEQLLSVVDSQNEQLKTQKHQIYKLMKSSGLQVQFENDLQAQNAKKIDALKAFQKDATARITALEAENKDVKEQLKAVPILRDGLSKTDEKVLKTEEQVQKLKAALTALSQTVDKTGKQAKSNAEHITQQAASLTEQGKQLQKAQTELQTLKQSTKDLASEEQDSADKLSEVQKAGKEMKKELDGQEETDQKAAKAMQALEASVVKHKQDLATLQSASSAVQKELTGVQSSIAGIQTANAETKKELAKLDALMKDLQDFAGAEAK